MIVMLNEILNYVASVHAEVDETNLLGYLKELNDAGMILQYLASGGELRNPINNGNPIPVNLIPAPIFSGTKRLCVDPAKNHYYLQVRVSEDTRSMRFLSCWKEVHVCGGTFRRPHSICAHCLYVKRQRNMIPEYIPVQPIIWFYRLDVSYGKLRVWLIKKLQEAIEFISDY